MRAEARMNFHLARSAFREVPSTVTANQYLLSVHRDLTVGQILDAVREVQAWLAQRLKEKEK